METPTSIEWRGEAACRGVEPDLFFANDTEVAINNKAKAICRRCPVRERCLDEEMGYERDAVGPRWGIRGGLDRKERKDLAEGRIRGRNKNSITTGPLLELIAIARGVGILPTSLARAAGLNVNLLRAIANGSRPTCHPMTEEKIRQYLASADLLPATEAVAS